MKLIGLTGGIGCGKTTVAMEFAALGIPCFEADRAGAGYYEQPEFLKEIQALFGNEVFNDDGTINKRKIASIVFADTKMLAKLNALIHPRVMQDFRIWAQRQQTPHVILESAILFEYELDKQVDKVIAVYLEKEERMRRLELRDKVTRAELEMRIRNQLSAEEKMDRADYVILNYEGNPRRRQVEHIDRMIRNL